jgi:hypothetical protein
MLNCTAPILVALMAAVAALYPGGDCPPLLHEATMAPGPRAATERAADATHAAEGAGRAGRSDAGTRSQGMDENIAPMVVTLVMVTAAVLIVNLVMRHKRQIRELLSRERLAALDKGVEIPWEMELKRPQRARRFQLKAGVLLLAAGVGLALIAPLQGSWNDQRDVLTPAIFLLVMGVAGVLYDRYVGKAEWERTIAMDEALTRAYIRRIEGSAERTRAAAREDERNPS